VCTYGVTNEMAKNAPPSRSVTQSCNQLFAFVLKSLGASCTSGVLMAMNNVSKPDRAPWYCSANAGWLGSSLLT
jgi:hypothetical protein